MGPNFDRRLNTLRTESTFSTKSSSQNLNFFLVSGLEAGFVDADLYLELQHQT